jgi:chromosome segregation ATPase
VHLVGQSRLTKAVRVRYMQMAEVVAARDALASEVKQAREQLEKLQAELAASKSEVVDLSAELQEKSARLAHLEGELQRHTASHVLP